MKYVLFATMWMLLAATPLASCARNDTADSNEPAVQLRDTVEVKQNRVWLSDLLPPDAPSAIQKASAAIELCQAPQLGSARVLDAEQITINLAEQPELLRQLVIPPRVTVRFSGWPIREETVRIAIAKFLSEQGWRRDLPKAARLEWLQPLSATEEPPRLQVMGLVWDNRQQSVQVRLRCATRASCGTFLVHVVLPAPLAEEWRNRLGSRIGLNSPQTGQVGAADGDGAVLAEKGKPATLILDDGSMRISVRVICLQSGLLNQQIRVFEARNRHVFHAEVVGAGLLHAAL